MTEPTYLHPTPNRRALLASIDAGHIRVDHSRPEFTGDAVDVRNGRLVAARAWELFRAGWVEDPAGAGEPWTLTDYGRAVQLVRIHDFGPLASPQLVAEVGDPDEPRVLGHVVHMPDAPRSARWMAVIGAIEWVVATRQKAWGELWHRACLAYAAQPPVEAGE